MANAPTFEEQVRSLECHFSWNIQNDIKSVKSENLETKLLAEVDGDPDIKIKSYLFLSYAFTVKDRDDTFDPQKALKYADTALDETSDDGEKFVAKANKSNILHMQRDSAASRELLKELLDYNTTPEVEASLALIEAHALCLLNFSSVERGLELCEKAIELNPSMGEAYFCCGLFMGRMRRTNKGPGGCPTDEELDALQKAMEFWDTSPLPYVFYALALVYGLYDNRERPKHVKEMETHLEKAMELASDRKHGIAFMRCAKGYRNLAKLDRMKSLKQNIKNNLGEYAKLMEKALKSALALCPNNSNVLHEAALCYWKSSQNMVNLDKAEAYLKKACGSKSNLHSNVWADIDLVKIRKQKNPHDYDALAAYIKLLPKYDNEPHPMQGICVEISKELHETGKTEGALDELRAALKLNPKNVGCRSTLVKVLLDVTTDRKSKYEEDETSASDYICVLLELAKTLEAFPIKMLGKAKELYSVVLQIDKDNADAMEGLTNIEHEERAKYEDIETPGDDDKVPGDDEKVPGDDEKVPGDDEKVVLSDDDVDSETETNDTHEHEECDVKVKRSTNKFYNKTKDIKDVYKMTSNPHGLAIIVNMTKDREGAMQDEGNVQALFEELKYEVLIQRDKTNQEILDYLKKVSTDEALKTHDGIVVFCMAHGQKDEILDIKKQRIRHSDIFEIFTNDKCPALREKPKMYFIQACRGLSEDRHVQGHSHPTEHPDGANIPATHDAPDSPVARYSDMLISQATVDGYTAYRDTEQGSRYVRAIVKVFREHAKHTHVSDLLTKVNHELQQMSAHPGAAKFDPKSKGIEVNMQCAETINRLTKRLYFFPGF